MRIIAAALLACLLVGCAPSPNKTKTTNKPALSWERVGVEMDKGDYCKYNLDLYRIPTPYGWIVMLETAKPSITSVYDPTHLWAPKQ